MMAKFIVKLKWKTHLKVKKMKKNLPQKKRRYNLVGRTSLFYSQSDALYVDFTCEIYTFMS